MVLSPEAYVAAAAISSARRDSNLPDAYWIRRLVLIAVVGYAIGEAWLLLGFVR